MRVLVTAAVLAVCLVGEASSQVRITEWQYNGSEYIEFTNLGTATVNFSGWSFSDESRAPGTVDLSAFGDVLAGESVILSEVPAADFRIEWLLDASVKVIGENSDNLGRGDEINLYNGLDPVLNLVDRLDFGDQADDFPGSIRTQDVSGNPSSPAVLGTNDVYGWVLSSVGDVFGSYSSANGFIGNPGTYAIVPEPTTLASTLLLSLSVLLSRSRYPGDQV